MELTQLRSFIAVAKHGHLTRASETLHLSQPALSAQIKALEETLGVTLFRRSPSGMILTSSGRVLLPRAEHVMEAMQEFRRAADALQGSLTGHLTLGTVLDPATLRLGELLNRMREHCPQLEIELRHVVSHEAVAGLRSGGLDVSFYFGAEPKDLQAVPLRELTYRVAMPLAWATEVTDDAWETLATRPWVVAPAQSSHRQLVLETFAERRHAPPEHIIEADNESVIVNLVESGVGASVVREELAIASAAEGRSAIWSDATALTTLWLAFDGERSTDPLVQALLAGVREVWAVPLALAA